MYWLRACGWDSDELNGPHQSIIDAAITARTLYLADDRNDTDRIWECEWVDNTGAISTVPQFDLLI
jgi:hypothetical protein